MRYLIDTHTFLWLSDCHRYLSATALGCIEDSENQLFLSSISAWEIEQKYKQVKLELPEKAGAFILHSLEKHHIQPLSFDMNAAALLDKLPDIPRDPFDRMLICQAIQHSLPIITNDRYITQYPVRVIW